MKAFSLETRVLHSAAVLPGFVHAWKLLLGLVEATGYARGLVRLGRKMFLIQALIDVS